MNQWANEKWRRSYLLGVGYAPEFLALDPGFAIAAMVGEEAEEEDGSEPENERPLARIIHEAL